MRAFRQYFQLTTQVAHVSRQVTVVHCLSHLRRQVGREIAAQVQYRGRRKRSTKRRTHTQARSYTSVHAGGQTNTHKGTKRETEVSGNGLGNPATTMGCTLAPPEEYDCPCAAAMRPYVKLL